MITFKISFHQTSDKSCGCSVDWGEIDKATELELKLAIPARVGIEKLLTNLPTATLVGQGVGQTQEEADLKAGIEADITRASQ